MAIHPGDVKRGVAIDLFALAERNDTDVETELFRVLGPVGDLLKGTTGDLKIDTFKIDMVEGEVATLRVSALYTEEEI